jgi:hypothetical protein
MVQALGAPIAFSQYSHVFGQVPVAASEYGNGTAITWSAKEHSNAPGNMAASVFGQARSAFLGGVRPLGHSFGKAGLFAEHAPRECRLTLFAGKS